MLNVYRIKAALLIVSGDRVITPVDVQNITRTSKHTLMHLPNQYPFLKVRTIMTSFTIH